MAGPSSVKCYPLYQPPVRERVCLKCCKPFDSMGDRICTPCTIANLSEGVRIGRGKRVWRGVSGFEN